MEQKYETLLHRWFEDVWNQGNEDAIDEMFPPDGLAHGLGSEAVRGAEGYKPFFRAFKNAFPDIKISVEDWVLDGDKLAVHCRAVATHTGEGLGFAPTNRAVDFSFMVFIRIKDDKIAEAWNILDSVKMYEQLGVLKINSE